MTGRDASGGGNMETRSGKPLFLHRNLNQDQLVTTGHSKGQDVLGVIQDAVPRNPSDMWESLWSSRLDDAAMRNMGLFTDPLGSGVASHFDQLRARLLLIVAANHWSRIAVTSPTPGCGKSFVAANLALSLARLPACRTVLMDLDLRAPRQAELFGQPSFPPLSKYLLGQKTIDEQFRRMGPNLAVALNGQAVPRSYEVLQDPVSVSTLEAMYVQLQPDITVFDMPPALESDDVLSMAPCLDAILLVIDGTSTTPQDIHRCTQMFDGHIPLAGVVVNKAQDRGLARLRRQQSAFGRR